MVARRDVDRDGVASGQRIVTDSFGESVDLFGHQPQVEQLFLRVAVYRMYFGIDPPQDFIPVDRESFSAFEVDRLDGEHLQLLVAREELRSVRPTRPDDDIGYHTAFVAPFDRGLHHVEPRIAEPRQCRAAERIAARECDGVDLDAADTGGFHDAQLAAQLFGFDFVAVPPPAYVGVVFELGILETFVSFGIETQRAGFGGFGCGLGQGGGKCGYEGACCQHGAPEKEGSSVHDRLCEEI